MNRPKIIGFYSYRGGVGRTTAVHNIGALLAASGRRVLMIDFDLEAPGLTQALASEVPSDVSFGVLALIRDFLDNHEPNWSVRAIDLPLPKIPATEGTRGRLALLPAGIPRAGTYSELLSQFHERRGEFGARSTELAGKLRAELQKRDEFDYVLVDSRTGRSDEAFLTCGHLADSLVVLTGLTRQHAEGTAAALNDLLDPTGTVSDLVIVVSPVPTHHYDAVEARLHEIRDVLIPPLLGADGRIKLESASRWHKLLTLSYDADVVFSDGLFVASRWAAPLTHDFLLLHQRIRSVCHDDADALTQSVFRSLGDRDFANTVLALQDLAGIAVLEGALADANIRSIRQQVSAQIFTKLPSELTDAVDLLEYLAAQDPNDHYSTWSLARIASEVDGKAGIPWWEKAERAAKDSNELDLFIIQMERAQVEDRWGMGVLPGTRHGQVRAKLEEMLQYQLPPSASLGVALTYHNLAEMARLQEDFSGERTYLEMALEVHQRLNDKRQEATAWHSLGLLDRLLGNFRSAEGHLRRALQMKEESKDYHGVAVVQHSLGELLRIRGSVGATNDWDEAKECFSSALTLTKQQDETLGRLVVLVSLGALKRSELDYEDAERVLLDALSIDVGETAKIERALAQLYLHAVRYEDGAESDLESLRRVTGCNELTRPDLEIQAKLVMAESLLGREGTANCEEAIRIAEGARGSARQMGFRSFEADADACLAVALTKLEKTHEAHLAAERCILFYDDQQVGTRLARWVNDLR